MACMHLTLLAARFTSHYIVAEESCKERGGGNQGSVEDPVSNGRSLSVTSPSGFLFPLFQLSCHRHAFEGTGPDPSDIFET